VDRHADRSSDTRVDIRKIKSRAPTAIRAVAAPPAPVPAAAAAGPPPVIGKLSGGAGLLGSGATRAGRGAIPSCRGGWGDSRAGARAGTSGRAAPPPSQDAGLTAATW
jgi:hypothetical protein